MVHETQLLDPNDLASKRDTSVTMKDTYAGVSRWCDWNCKNLSKLLLSISCIWQGLTLARKNLVHLPLETRGPRGPEIAECFPD